MRCLQGVSDWPRLFPVAAILLSIGTWVVPDIGHATNDDLPENISDSEYQTGLEEREGYVAASLTALNTAKSALALAETALLQAETNINTALGTFERVEFGGDETALTTAWSTVSTALTQWSTARNNYQAKLSAKMEAEETWHKNRIWLEQFKNDYEAQTTVFAVRDGITRCETDACTAASFLNDERFTTFQPNVLEMVGAHYAYAKGLTGQGVRIGIQDDAVNYFLPEFAGRISFDGAVLTYPVPFGDNTSSDAKACASASAIVREFLGCTVFTYSADDDVLHDLTARWVVANYGWPDEGEDWFLRNDAEEEGSLWRWSKIPSGTSASHGTTVASVAAGRDFGIAPGATVVPVVKDFSWDGQFEQSLANTALLTAVRGLSASSRQDLDERWADEIEADYANFDVINRSYGIPVFDPVTIGEVLNSETEWWGASLRRIVPQYWRALMQTGTHPDDRTVVVYAAGNESEEFGGLGADIPYYEPHVRGSQLSVMAVDHDGTHSDYTNFCGALPTDWDAERWGRHFCLAAPGTVNAAGSSGQGYIWYQTEGTSFAAPVVTGAIALLMEHFRGQLGNTEIVKRVVNTADNDGRYAQWEIYGAGLLDLEAALLPVGTTVTGTPAVDAEAASTAIYLPLSVGSFGGRLASTGIEVVSLDSLGAPFWSSPKRFIRRTSNLSARIPVFADPEEQGGWKPHLGFTPGTFSTAAGRNGLNFLVGENRVGLERVPSEGMRWGVLMDGASWHGGRVSGAFGNQIRSATAWVGRTGQLQLNDVWSLRGSATLAVGRASLQSERMLRIEPYAMSAWDVGIERGDRGRGTWSRLSVAQPVRTEAGTGTLTYLSGLQQGKRVYNRARVSLVPEGREIELALTHETPIGRGRGVVEVAHSWEAAHDTGRSVSRIGVAYRLMW